MPYLLSLPVFVGLAAFSGPNHPPDYSPLSAFYSHSEGIMSRSKSTTGNGGTVTRIG